MWKNNLQLKNSETYLSTDNRSCNFPTKFCGKYSSSLAYAHFVISQKMHSLFFSLIVRHKRFCFGFPFILISSILVFSQIISYVFLSNNFLFWKFFRMSDTQCPRSNDELFRTSGYLIGRIPKTIRQIFFTHLKGQLKYKHHGPYGI